LTSVLAMFGLIAGLGYGGYGLLQDIQRVRVAPLPEAPEVVVEAPVISAPSIEAGLLRRPDATAYQGDGVLAAAAPADLLPPALPARDGPISAIDPATSGIFSGGSRDEIRLVSARQAEAGHGVSAEDAAIFAAHADPAPVIAAAPPSGPPSIVIHATDAAWIRVNDGAEAIIFEGILTAGNRFEIPDRVAEPLLRTGNAGAVYVLVGDAAYGPVGASGRVVSNLSLRANDIENLVPQASAETIRATQGDDPLQRAEAVVLQ
jgi:hypothetical protein